MSNVIFDEILGKLRSADVSGGTGGTSYVGGNRIAIAGETISFVNSADIVNVTGTSVTLQPDTAYKIYATSQAITLNANPPAAGKWAYEGHLEIFVAGTGYIVTGTNVVLANALEPDAVNNCTVRFHDGIAIISVEDHVAGYIVVNGTTAGDGSLYYGITTSTNDYVAFDASLNGTTIPLAGAVAEGEKHLVGNGYTSTTLTGAVDCGTSKFTVANLALNNVQVTGGTMTLGDAFIPSGSTVAVSGGGLAVEKVTGNGGVIDLGGNTRIGLTMTGNIFHLSSVSIVNGSGVKAGGVYIANASAYLTECTIANNSGGGAYVGSNGGIGVFSGCTFSNPNTAGLTVNTGATARVIDCVFSGNKDDIVMSGGSAVLSNTNKIETVIISGALTASGAVTLTSGAILDLTGNTNATPIAPGGGIVFSGANQIIYGATENPTTAYIDGCTAATIASGGVVSLNRALVYADIPSGGTWSASNVTFGAITGKTSSFDCTDSATLIKLDNISATGNVALRSPSSATNIVAPAAVVVIGNDVHIFGANNNVLACSSFTSGDSFLVTLEDNCSITIGDSKTISSTNGVVVKSGVTVNGHDIASGTYAAVNADGTTVPI